MNFKQKGNRSSGGFNRGFGGGGRSGGRNGGRDGGRDGGSRPDMHKATCSECGTNCEIPFKPSGDRPVFCSDCFKNQGGSDSRSSRFGDKRRERSNFRDRERHSIVCDQCGKNCQVPFKPTAGKPIFCDDCFKQAGKKKGEENKNSSQIMEQISLLNNKIDQLMLALIPEIKSAIKKEAKTKRTTKKTTTKKATKTKTVKKKASAKKKK